jgi:hypothetical protein
VSRPNGDRTRFAVVAVLAASCFVSACAGGRASNSSTTTVSRPIAPPPGFDRLGAAATARALGNPAQVDAGVWSILSHLGIGVYSRTGRQLLAGSERGPGDFWISDTAVPVLERMASAPRVPFVQYAAYLHAHGAKQSEPALLRAYAAAYAGKPSAFLAQLLRALHVRFDAALRISPLVEWLLLLDTVVPSNGARLSRFEQTACALRGDGRAAGWGIAGAALPGVGAAFGDNAALATEALLVANAAQIDVYTDPGEVHEGHSGPGAVETLRVNAQLGVTPYPAGCLSSGWSIDAVTVLSDMLLDWDIDPPEAMQHGSLVFNGPADGLPQPRTKPNLGKSVTTVNGSSKVAFQTIEEPSHGKGNRHTLHVRAIVTADVKAALASHGVDPSLLQYMPALPTVSVARFVVSWHEDTEQWTGTVHASRTYTDSQSTSKLKWAGTASLSVDEKGKVSGRFDVTGTLTSVTEFGTITLPDTASWQLSGERTDNGLLISSASFGAPNAPGSYFDEVIPNIPFTIPVASPDHISTTLTPLLSGGALQLELTCPTCGK